MTILLDFSLIAPGGSSTYATAFLSALSLRDDLADIVVLVPEQDHDLNGVIDQLILAGARVQRTNLGSGWKSAVRRQLLVPYYSLRYRAKAVFSPREAAPLLTPTHLVVLARNLKVWSPSGSTTISARGRFLARTLLARLSVIRAARVLAVSSVMARALPARVARSAIVVHHGCDLELVDQSRLEGTNAPESLRIVALGTISEHKRFDRLVEAVALLRELGQPGQLDIWGPVGDPVCAVNLSQSGHEKLGGDPLRGPAAAHQRQRILADADVLAMSSSVESFGLPLLEGMRTSCLVWVPASDLVDELCGLVAVTYPEGSAMAAARALVAALPEARNRLSQGRDRCSSFTWDSTVEQTLRALRCVAR